MGVGEPGVPFRATGFSLVGEGDDKAYYLS